MKEQAEKVADTLISAIPSTSSVFESVDDQPELVNVPGALDGIAERVANECSRWQIENTIAVLERALNRK